MGKKIAILAAAVAVLALVAAAVNRAYTPPKPGSHYDAPGYYNGTVKPIQRR